MKTTSAKRTSCCIGRCSPALAILSAASIQPLPNPSSLSESKKPWHVYALTSRNTPVALGIQLRHWMIPFPELRRVAKLYIALKSPTISCSNWGMRTKESGQESLRKAMPPQRTPWSAPISHSQPRPRKQKSQVALPDSSQWVTRVRLREDFSQRVEI